MVSAAQHYIAVLLTGFLLGHRISAQQTLDELFNVQTSGTASCSDTQVQDLEVWLDESYQMTVNALAAIDAYQNDVTTRKTIGSYLGIKPTSKNGNVVSNPDDLAKVRSWFDDVAKFLRGEITISMFGKPRLFCDDSYIVPRSWDQTAQDSDDADVFCPPNGVPDDDEDKLLERGWQCPTVPSGVTPAAPEPAILEYLYHAAYVYKGGIYLPFRNTEYKTYEWGPKDYTGGHFCGGSDNLAATTDGEPSHMFFCPGPTQAFFIYHTNFGNIPTPATRSAIDKYFTRSISFLHELFHLVEGHAATPDDCYTFRECVADVTYESGDAARRSPECYALFAQAMWLAKNRGWRFPNGFAQQLQNGVDF